MDKIFFEHPREEYHVRQLARLLRKSPTTVSTHLERLHRQGLLRKRRERHHLLFAADTDNASFKARKIAYNREKLARSGLIERLAQEYNSPEAIVLFGSYARGEDTEKSDIDIAVITPLKKSVSFPDCERKLKRALHLTTLSREDVETMKGKNKEFLNSLVNGAVVGGFWEVFR